MIACDNHELLAAYKENWDAYTPEKFQKDHAARYLSHYVKAVVDGDGMPTKFWFKIRTTT